MKYFDSIILNFYSISYNLKLILAYFPIFIFKLYNISAGLKGYLHQFYWFDIVLPSPCKLRFFYPKGKEEQSLGRVPCPHS